MTSGFFAFRIYLIIFSPQSYIYYLNLPDSATYTAKIFQHRSDNQKNGVGAHIRSWQARPSEVIIPNIKQLFTFAPLIVIFNHACFALTGGRL
jgi:hypothetical protein